MKNLFQKFLVISTLAISTSLMGCGDGSGYGKGVFVAPTASPSPSSSASSSSGPVACSTDVINLLTNMGAGQTYTSSVIDASGGAISDFSPNTGYFQATFEIPATLTNGNGTCAVIPWHMYTCHDVGCGSYDGSQSGSSTPQSVDGSGYLVMPKWFTEQNWSVERVNSCSITFHIGSHTVTLSNAVRC